MLPAKGTAIAHETYGEGRTTGEFHRASPDAAHPGEWMVRVWFPAYRWTTFGGEPRVGLGGWFWASLVVPQLSASAAEPG